MVTPSSPSASSRVEAVPEEDWPAQVAGSIEQVVQTVRDRTTGPALTIARAIVFGVFAAVVITAALVLLVIAGVRLLDSYLPSAVFGDEHTWAAHMIMGLLFCVAAVVFWVKRR